MKAKILFLITIFLFLTVLTCDKKPTTPTYDNPFDIENPQTGGDPFQLTAIIANGGITLEWNKPEYKELLSFKIYRSEQESSGYAELGTATASQTQYIDKQIENGHSYWYLVTVVDTKDSETSRTNTASVNIKTEPVLTINGGAEYTATRDVSLTILAITAQQMMLSNNADFSGASWEINATSKYWMLTTGEGEKTVYLKVKYDNDIESEDVNYKIILDTTLPAIALTITPDSGITSETNFKFDPTASSDNLALAKDLQIRFDFQNDGTYDTDWQQLAVRGKQYILGGGVKIVKMQLKDGAGWQVETTKDIYVNTRPKVFFTAIEDELYVNIWHFDASFSSDFEDGENIEYRWDFDGDGGWDTGWLAQDKITYEYANYGYFNAKLIVRDHNALNGEQTVQLLVVPFMTDIDSNVYKIVKIGNQWWMAENLKVTRYYNGDGIPNVTDNTEWTNLTTGAWCAFGYISGNIDTYGLLYNWYVVDDSREIAPEGWHVPTDEEWKEMEIYLGMSQSEADDTEWRGTNEGNKLKSTSGWYSDGNGTNESGFTALPGGYRIGSNGSYDNIGTYGYWWSATAFSSTGSTLRVLGYNHSGVDRFSYDKRAGFSLRLIRN